MDILLADGDVPFLSILEEMIRCGCSCDASLHIEKATAVDQVVKKLTGNGFDVCFLGDSLEDGTAGDIFRTVNPQDLRTAFIVLASFADKRDAYTALNFGAMNYLVKDKLDSFGVGTNIAFSLFRKYREMELRRAAFRDHLTGLGNRMFFWELSRKILLRAKRARDYVGVLFLDVDGFKPINDNYGHHVGDQLLKQIASRLTERVRESDIVARLGGDEFVVLLGRVNDRETVTQVSEDLANTVRQKAFPIDNHEIWIGMSYGTAIFPEDSESIDGLVQVADHRMYEAKALQRKNNPRPPMIWNN